MHDWSAPDRIVLRHLDDIARERPELRAVRVDVDRAPKLANRYDILAVPTAMVFDGGEPRGRPIVGAFPRARWEDELQLDAVAP